MSAGEAPEDTAGGGRDERSRRRPEANHQAVFAELLAHPGVLEQLELRSRFGFMAVHGGSLERGTAEVAGAAAERAGASLYAVVQPEDLRWHLPSRLCVPVASPALAEFLDSVDVVVSIHGYGRARMWTSLLVGGANRALAHRIGGALRAALPGYEVVDDLAAIPDGLRGLHPANPVNRARLGGVQLELPPRVRGLGPNGSAAATDALTAALAGLAALDAVRLSPAWARNL